MKDDGQVIGVYSNQYKPDTEVNFYTSIITENVMTWLNANGYA